MLQGLSLQQLAQEVKDQQDSKRDFLIDSSIMDMSVLPIPDARQETLDHCMTLGKNGNSVALRVNDLGHDQLANRIGIPRKYYQHLRDNHPQLLCDNVNGLAHAEPQKMLVRSQKNTARAFLSDRYRTIDNYDLLSAMLPIITDPRQIGTEMEVVACQLTDKRMYIKILFPRVTGEIKVGDTVRAGVCISNSEVGSGSVKVERLAEILRCLNGLILPASLRKYHAGRRHEFSELDEAVEVYSDRTKQLDDQAFFSKVADVVKAAFNIEEFNKQLESFRETTENVIKKPPMEFIEVTAKRFGLVETEKTNTMKHFLQYSDFSQYGLMNALTSTAQEPGTDWDRSIELERLGAQVLNLPAGQWKEIAGQGRVAVANSWDGDDQDEDE